tara:strand:+ start:1865 stop:2083 length:219 start_codon:yes stop_codon:yes gene_type:complete
MSKNKIKIPIIYKTDENGFKRYDFEEMCDLFGMQLSELDNSVVTMCSTEPEIGKIINESNVRGKDRKVYEVK